MTEKEKMLAGFMYYSGGEELTEDRYRAKDLCLRYNAIAPRDREAQKEIILRLFGKVGKNFCIEPSLWCDYGYNIEIGDNFYANHNLLILDCAKVTFGDNVFIAPNCSFYTAGHPLDPTLRNELWEYAHPITVGSNVWIGGSVVVVPGVNIGSNTVIGAGSVVTKDIPDGVVAAGNPCRVIKKVTDEDKSVIWKS